MQLIHLQKKKTEKWLIEMHNENQEDKLKCQNKNENNINMW